jgi:inner membrane protein
MGLKFLLVCALALLMSIPAMLVNDIVRERAAAAAGVRTQIGAVQGGRQTLIGPVLVVPHTQASTLTEIIPQPDGSTRRVRRTELERGRTVIFAETGTVSAVLHTDLRARSVYRVPVYTADIAISAAFDIAKAREALDPGNVLDWQEARIVMWVSDLRGARDVINVNLPDAPARAFEPASDQALSAAPGVGAQEAQVARDAAQSGAGLQAMEVRLGDRAGPRSAFTARIAMKLAGADALAVAAFANDTSASIRGDWDDPAFIGAFPPLRRGTPSGRGETADGAWTRTAPGQFTSDWRATYLARGLPKAGVLDQDVTIPALADKTFAVSLLDTKDVYVGVDRALKYALMFIGVLFLSYFMFEARSNRRAHAAQYLLVGLAHCVFYLLLLALAERIGFDGAFTLAAGATVLVSAAYAAAVFKSPAKGIQAGVIFAFVYALLYVLLTREDDALLVGAVTVFAVLALVMWLTRNINWYGGAATPVEGAARDRA